MKTQQYLVLYFDYVFERYNLGVWALNSQTALQYARQYRACGLFGVFVMSLPTFFIER